MECKIINSDCTNYLRELSGVSFDLTFLDPPFNQNKEYSNHHDNMNPNDYWKWMKDICKRIHDLTKAGGAIYFMQREKNTRYVLDILESTGWTFQNMIIWKKKTSAVPGVNRFGKHYQIIGYSTKGKKPRVFNKLRINPPLLETEKNLRLRGRYVTDVWDDIREMTSGYFAGKEPIRLNNGDRAHNQQSPIRLLARIILSSTNVGDIVFDPFAGTGTTLVVAKQLQRNSIGIEIDPNHVKLIKNRISNIKKPDRISSFRNDYLHTESLDEIWPSQTAGQDSSASYIHDSLPLLNYIPKNTE